MSIAPYGGGTTQTPSTQTPSTQTPTTQTPPSTETPPTTQTPVTTPPATAGGLGSAVMGGAGQTTDRYRKADVTRDGQNYYLMANGWGPGFQSQSLSWNGTSFTVEAMQGEQGMNYEPASYPTVFCGVYSTDQSRPCGLPATVASLTTLRTGWSWRPNDNDPNAEYNAAYDIWVGNGTTRNDHSGFLMVWYREPPGQQPAGSLQMQNVTVANVTGTWDIWTGSVGNKPIINWVRRQGQDTLDMEFDVMDFIRDAQTRGLTIPGTHVLSVAVGFEMWNGPITNLESVDFYVDVN